MLFNFWQVILHVEFPACSVRFLIVHGTTCLTQLHWRWATQLLANEDIVTIEHGLANMVNMFIVDGLANLVNMFIVDGLARMIYVSIVNEAGQWYFVAELRQVC